MIGTLTLGLALLAALPPVETAALGAEKPAAASKTEPSGRSTRDNELRRAYQKELAFLNAQREALRARVEENQARLRALDERSKGEQAELERSLLGARVTAESVARELESLERESDATSDENPTAGVLEQIRALVGLPLEVDADSPAAEVDAIATGLASAIRLIDERAAVRVGPGAFFDESGRKREGEIVWVGEVAAFGVAPDVAGPLVPAGAGALKLFGPAEGNSARAVREGSATSGFGVFLFEDAAKAVEQRPEKSALEVVESGGSIAWVIVGLGLVAALLMVVRALTLLILGRGRFELLDTVRRGLMVGALDETLAYAKGASGAMASVLVAAVGTLRGPRIVHEDAIEEAILREGARLDRFSTLILVSAAVAPLLGLLGTVTGMIATFDTITEFGTGDPRMLSGGISEALVTTELGLIVAIPSLLIGNLLSGWGERIKRDLDTGALGVANAYATKKADEVE